MFDRYARELLRIAQEALRSQKVREIGPKLFVYRTRWPIRLQLMVSRRTETPEVVRVREGACPWPVSAPPPGPGASKVAPKPANASDGRAVFITHDGTTDNLSGWAARMDVPIRRVERRRARGWTHRQAVGIDPPPKRKPKGQTYEHDGTTDTILGWSRRTGIPEVTIRHRLDVGWTFSQALEEEDPPAALWTTLTHNGVEDTVPGWAKRLGVSETFIRKRLRAGFSVEEALDVDAKRQPLPPITHGGLTMSLADWSRESGVPQPVLKNRLRLEWSPAQSLGVAPAPVQVGGRRYSVTLSSDGAVELSTREVGEWSRIASGRWVFGRIVDLNAEVDRPVVRELEAEVRAYLRGKAGQKWWKDGEQ